MEKKQKLLFTALILAAAFIAAAPLFVLSDAEFGGSDDAGSVMAEEINGEYTPWFTPVLETLTGGELPGEAESLIFCLQTAIGTGILAFCMGRLYERNKRNKEQKNS